MHFMINNLSTDSIHNTVIICKQHLKRVNVILQKNKTIMHICIYDLQYTVYLI